MPPSNIASHRNESSSRRLAAILFADIAGYTAMMQSDEGKTMNKLRHYQAVLKSEVAQFKGEIIKNYGDGSLCLFPSVLDAVHCAKSLQEIFRSEPVIPLRIGLHLGDVMYEENDVYGNDLNIASRIESMGIVGSVLMSKNVLDKVKNQADLKFTSLGSFEFKNVDESMEIFALANEGFVVPKKDQMKGKLKTSKSNKSKWQIPVVGLLALAVLISGYFFLSKSSKDQLQGNTDEFISSIAVFPFDVKGSSDIEYLGEGIVDLVSTQLDEIPKLNSIDPNRIFSLLESETDISRKPERATQLCTTYGATKFILGSIVQVGEDLQISATKYNAQGKELTRQSVKAMSGENLSKSIDNLIQKLVADELQTVGFELGSLGALTSNNLESLKSYLQGEQAYRALDYKKALELFSKATEQDSTFALAWMRLRDADSWIGWDYNNRAFKKWGEYKHTMPEKWQLYYEAVTMGGHPDLKIRAFKNLIQRYGDTPAFHYELAEFYFHLNEAYGRSPSEAKPYLLKTIELDPGNQEALRHLGDIAIMENDMEAMEEVLSWSNKENGGLLMRKLIIQDTVTDAEIEHVLSLGAGTSFFPLLYFASEEKPFHNELISRIVQLRPSANGERFANATRFATTGREKEGFFAWKEMAKVDFSFGVISIEQLSRCIPATLMVAEDFLPFSEHYESLYLDTKDRDTPWETYAAIKYALALNKPKDVAALKQKLQSLGTTPQTNSMVKYFSFSIQAFEAKMKGENDKALALIDSVYNNPIGFWETQCASADKSILAANIYAEQGEFEKAINYFNHSYVIVIGGDIMMGYRNYKLSQWYEAIGDTQNALTKCNILIESYQNCDEKYRPWVEEAEERRVRLMANIQ